MVTVGAQPFGPDKASHAVLFIHGWTSTPGELQPLAESLSKQGFDCKVTQLPGHGTTPADLENLTWRDHLKHVLGVIDSLHKDYAKVSIVGSSFGATLALHASLATDICNLVLLAPFIIHTSRSYGLPHSFWVKIVPSFIMKFVPKSMGSDIIKESEKSTFFAYDKMPLKSLKSVFSGVYELKPKLGKIRNSIFIAHNINDRVAEADGSIDVMMRVASNDKMMMLLNDKSHAPLFDNNREHVEAEIINWMNRRK